jgi:hypothetical protein
LSTPTVLGTTGAVRDIDQSYNTFYLADSGNLTNIPYVFQEVNGLCHWATQTMALNAAGFSLDLADVCAVTGIGYSMAYIRYEDNWLFAPGPMYRQQASLADISEFYGLDTELYFDSNCSDYASLVATTMQTIGVNWTEIEGWDDAFQILKESIDDGFPVEIHVNLYHIPHPDYDIARELLTSDSDPSHSILITGYNETAGVVYTMDPGIGVLDTSEVLPSEDSGFYEINFTSLNLAWCKTYAATVIKPSTGINEDFTNKLGYFIIDRLRGDRSSYAADAEDVFFLTFGADAYRAMASDLTDTSFSLYLDEFDEYNLHTRATILKYIGLEMESYLTLQYVSYQKALYALPDFLPELDLDSFVSAGEQAFAHFETMSNYSSLNSISYTGGATIVSETFSSLAYDYEFVHDGNIPTSVAEYEADLSEIRLHLNAIADAWDAAATALEQELVGPGLPFIASMTGIGAIVVIIPSMTGIGAIVVITIAIISKRRREAGT